VIRSQTKGVCTAGELRPLRYVKSGEIFFQVFKLRKIVVDDVGIIRIALEKILMVVLGRIKGMISLDFGDNRTRIHFGGVELGNVRLGDAFLFGAGEENCRAVLRAAVRPLAIPLGWIVSDGKENHKKLAVSDFRRIKNDADGFGVTSNAHAYAFVGGRLDKAAGVAGSDRDDTFQMLENGLNAPEASASEDGRLVR